MHSPVTSWPNGANIGPHVAAVLSMKLTASSVLPLVLACLSACPAIAGQATPLASLAQPPATHADWTSQAIALERGGDWQGLAELGRRWIHAAPRNASAWFVLGRALGALGRYPEAIAAYRQALALEPGDVYARNNLGNAYRDSGQFRQAMQTYRDAVRIDSGYVPAWQNLGRTFFMLKGMAGVSQALQQLRATDPQLADAWQVLAIGYSQTHDERIAQQAITVLRGLSADQRERLFSILFASV